MPLARRGGIATSRRDSRGRSGRTAVSTARRRRVGSRGTISVQGTREGSRGSAHLPESGERHTRPTCAERGWGVSRPTGVQHRRQAAPRDAVRCLTSDGLGKQATSTTRPVVGRHARGARAGGHATPTARSHPRACRAAAGRARGQSSSRRAAGCRPEGCGCESRWSRSVHQASGARAVREPPRSGGGVCASRSRRVDRRVSTPPGATTGCPSRLPRRAKLRG